MQLNGPCRWRNDEWKKQHILLVPRDPSVVPVSSDHDWTLQHEPWSDAGVHRHADYWWICVVHILHQDLRAIQGSDWHCSMHIVPRHSASFTFISIQFRFCVCFIFVSYLLILNSIQWYYCSIDSLMMFASFFLRLSMFICLSVRLFVHSLLYRSSRPYSTGKKVPKVLGLLQSSTLKDHTIPRHSPTTMLGKSQHNIRYV